MECPRCKHGISIEEYYSIFKNHTDIDTPLPFSPCFVLKHHEAFRAGLTSLSNNKKEFIFFDDNGNGKKKMNRPVLLHSLSILPNNEDYLNDSLRATICLIEMKMNHVYKGQQLPLYTVTRPESTTMIDGTIYLIVRDKFDFHIRLVISNWSYVTPTNEVKSSEELSRIFDDLLPINNMITLLDPCLTVCAIDGQLSLRCDTPNIDLILIERMRKCFVLDKLDELRDRGNQAYIHGDIQIAIDYYSFAINRIVAMAEMVISNENDCETNLFVNAFQRDLSRFHSNRSACYLRERLYANASLDSLVIVTGHSVGRNYDEYFLKCLYRLVCANIGLQEFTLVLDGLFHLSRDASINHQLRIKFSMDFDRLQSALTRWKQEHQHGEYDLKRMFINESIDQTTLFDIHMFHANFKNDLYIQKRRAKRVIPSGTLLLAQHAFAFVKSGANAERRLLNEIEKHLAMTPANTEFDLIRIMPWIDKWFQNEANGDSDDSESYPKTLPWRLLVKTQRENPFRSKSLVGWWPEASIFKVAADSKQKANCLWFICGKILFLFNFISINKNDELIIANNKDIGSFLEEHRKQFVFSLNTKTKVPLNHIFDKLKMTQCFFDE